MAERCQWSFVRANARIKAVSRCLLFPWRTCLTGRSGTDTKVAAAVSKKQSVWVENWPLKGFHATQWFRSNNSSTSTASGQDPRAPRRHRGPAAFLAPKMLQAQPVQQERTTNPSSHWLLDIKKQKKSLKRSLKQVVLCVNPDSAQTRCLASVKRGSGLA